MPAKTGIRTALAALLAAGGVLPVAQALDIGLQPASVEVEIDPGARSRQVVTLANPDGDRPVSVSLGLADWMLDEDGTVVFVTPGESEASAAGWARFRPGTVTLGPGQSKQVVIDLAAPDGLARSGDYRFALLASTVQPDGAGGWKKHRTASLFSLTAGKAASRPEITDGRLTVTADGRPAIGLDIRNRGNAHARLEGRIEIRSGDGTARSVPVRDLMVPEGGVRRFLVPVGEAPPDGAVIDVRLDNVFAPQQADETEPLAPYRIGPAPAPADLSGPVGGQD